MVDHVHYVTDKPFARVQAAFEGQLGKSPLDAFDELAGYDTDKQKAILEAMAGTSGFMLFGTIDHSRGLQLVGQHQIAIQYIVGNPLFAIQMTKYDTRAALYVPLRVLLYENECGQTCLEYDKPSRLIGQFGNDHINRTAIMLDQKRENLAESAMR
jgi:uncharacterized protein (DUF302 family)